MKEIAKNEANKKARETEINKEKEKGSNENSLVN